MSQLCGAHLIAKSSQNPLRRRFRSLPFSAWKSPWYTSHLAAAARNRTRSRCNASQESSTRCRVQFTVELSSSPHCFTKGKRSFLLLISQKNRLRRAAKAAFCRGAALRGQNRLPPLLLSPPSPVVGVSPPRALPLPPYPRGGTPPTTLPLPPYPKTGTPPLPTCQKPQRGR